MINKIECKLYLWSGGVSPTRLHFTYDMERKLKAKGIDLDLESIYTNWRKKYMYESRNTIEKFLEKHNNAELLNSDNQRPCTLCGTRAKALYKLHMNSEHHKICTTCRNILLPKKINFHQLPKMG